MTLLTVKDVAARLQVKDKTVYAWASQGKIPCLKVNGVIRFEAGDIEQWLEGCRVRAVALRRSQKSTRKGPQRARVYLDGVIERAKKTTYNRPYGETRPTASPKGKEEEHGAR